MTQRSLDLTPEARAYLAENPLAELDAALVRRIVRQKLRERAFWESDAGASGSEVDRAASEMSATLDDVRQACEDALDPLLRTKRIFLNNLMASEGDEAKIMEAYQVRANWESKNAPMTFSNEDAKLHGIQMIRLFESIFSKAREGNPAALDVLRKLLLDFGEVPGFDLKAWFRRRIEDIVREQKGEFAALTLRARFGERPAEFDAIFTRFLSGGSFLQLEPHQEALPERRA